MHRGKKEVIKKQEILQAIILADDYTEKLAPMNKYYPVVLTPIANIPLLDYIVETLIASKVQEIYIYCTNYVEDLKRRINEIKRVKNINISLLINEGCYSMGDAIRDIDSKGNIRGDFILVQGNAMTNANLQHFVMKHKIRANNDKGAIMTMIMDNVGSKENSSLKDELYCIVSSEKSKKMVYYDKLKSNDNKVLLPRMNTFFYDKLRLNTNLVDSHVYICSPAVLSLFSDNFDFQTMNDFIKGIIINEEILDSRIYWEPLLFRTCALPITSWKTYNSVNRDVLRRKFFPFVPESITHQEYEVFASSCFYKHFSATVNGNTDNLQKSIIGKNSKTGDSTSCVESVIGPNCKIGKNVKIRNSYIMSDVTIEDNSNITQCVIFQNSWIPENSILDGCIVSALIKLDSKNCSFVDCMIMNENDEITTLSLKTPDDDDNDDCSIERGHFFKYFEEDEKEEVDEDIESASEDENEVREEVEDEEEDVDNQFFFSEVSDSLLRGYQEKLNTDNLILEINSSRYAYNVQVDEVTRIVTKCILKLPIRYLEEANVEVTTKEYLKTLKGVMTFFEEILIKYNKTKVAQFKVLKAFEEVANSLEHFLLVFKNILNYFYEKDFLEEKTILEWFKKYEENDGSEKLNLNIKTAAQPFIDWLKEAEEDDSDEESDDE